MSMVNVDGSMFMVNVEGQCWLSMLMINVDGQCRCSMLKCSMLKLTVANVEARNQSMSIVNVEVRNVNADRPCQQSISIVNVQARCQCRRVMPTINVDGPWFDPPCLETPSVAWPRKKFKVIRGKDFFWPTTIGRCKKIGGTVADPQKSVKS